MMWWLLIYLCGCSWSTSFFKIYRVEVLDIPFGNVVAPDLPFPFQWLQWLLIYFWWLWIYLCGGSWSNFVFLFVFRVLGWISEGSGWGGALPNPSFFGFVFFVFVFFFVGDGGWWGFVGFVVRRQTFPAILQDCGLYCPNTPCLKCLFLACSSFSSSSFSYVILLHLLFSSLSIFRIPSFPSSFWIFLSSFVHSRSFFLLCFFLVFLLMVKGHSPLPKQEIIFLKKTSKATDQSSPRSGSWSTFFGRGASWSTCGGSSSTWGGRRMVNQEPPHGRSRATTSKKPIKKLRTAEHRKK